MNYIVTGLISSGKSTFLNIAEENKFRVLRSDDLVSDCYNDKNTISTLKDKLNIASVESVTKKIVKDYFLESDSNRKIIEDIFHPIIHSIINRELSLNNNLIVEVPAIKNNKKLIRDNKSVFIESNNKNRLEYFKKKNANELEFFEKINEYQKDYSSIRSYCDIIISNNDTVDQLYKYFNEVIIKS